MVVIQADLLHAGTQRSLTFEGLDAATILRCERRYFFPVDGQSGAVGLEEELVITLGLEINPALEAQGHVVVNSVKVAQRKISRLAGTFRFDRFMTNAFPDLPTVHRVVQVARHAGVAEEVMGNTFQFAGRQFEVGHPARWAAQVGLAEELDQTAQAIFIFERTEWHGFWGKRLAALGIAGRVTGGATAGVKKFFPLGRGHGVRRLWSESRSLERKQKLC